MHPSISLNHLIVYNVEPFESLGTQLGDICERRDTLPLRRDVSLLYPLYRIYHGECSHHLDTWHPLLCGVVGTSFHAPRTNGMAYPRQCFQVDMTWVPSKGVSISTLKAGNAPVAFLVLQGVVDGGDHLPSGDPNPRLPCLFHKEKNAR